MTHQTIKYNLHHFGYELNKKPFKISILKGFDKF